MDFVGARATDLAQPVDRNRWWNADDDSLAADWRDGLPTVRSPERRAAMRDRVLRSADALRRRAEAGRRRS